MALPVLDGNQSATTLSSVVTGGEHIVAHSVVSLGATAISNINSAVSGTAVTIPGLARLGNSIASDNTADANLDFIKIGGHQDGQNQVAHIVHVSAGGAMKVDASGSSVTFSQAPVTFGAITGSASILNFPSTQTIAGTVTANLNTIQEGAFGAYDSGSGTAINQNLAVVRGSDAALWLQDGGGNVPISGTVTVGNSVTIGSLPAISGTVTANANYEFEAGGSGQPNNAIQIGYYKGSVFEPVTEEDPLPVSGTVTVGNSVTIGSVPNGSLTTRFGTPTTANVSFATSAVTNTNRKYLLIQNVTTGSNVITVGIGFTPTTTQGIQLTAGAGITFESSYIPTGAVQILSSVTASNFTILEA